MNCILGLMRLLKVLDPLLSLGSGYSAFIIALDIAWVVVMNYVAFAVDHGMWDGGRLSFVIRLMGLECNKRGVALACSCSTSFISLQGPNENFFLGAACSGSFSFSSLSPRGVGDDFFLIGGATCSGSFSFSSVSL